MPRVQHIYDALNTGRLQDAIAVAKPILELKRITLDELHKQLKKLLDLYVMSLESEFHEVAMDRLQVELQDSKLIALTIGKLTFRIHDKYKKDIEKRARRKEKVYLIAVVKCFRRKDKRENYYKRR